MNRKIHLDANVAKYILKGLASVFQLIYSYIISAYFGQDI